MPELSCTVQTCVHNYQYLCELDKIQVGGNSAKNAQETCCDSFEERREGSYSNKTDSMKSVSDCSDVDCQAKACRYNEECKCHAGKSVQKAVTPATAVGQNVQHLIVAVIEYQIKV